MATTAIPLGRLENIELRAAFPSEAQNLTPWLAEPENLCLLAATLGLELECAGQEQWVGPFRADILCRNLADESWVLIENQLERTDHSHLGQLITYAAGLDTATIIWVAQRFTEEHRAALDWLNQITDQKFNFFGVEIELWRIGTSEAAPKFNIVAQPNEWTKTVRSAKDQDLSGTKRQQFEFWTKFHEYMQEHSHIRCQAPFDESWITHSIGRSGAHLASVIIQRGSSGTPEIRAELVIQDNKAWYQQLLEQKNEIEQSLGLPLNWHNPDGKKKTRIFLRTDLDYSDEEQWDSAFQWLQKHLESLERVFRPRVKALE